jgi:hypothetical protein
LPERQVLQRQEARDREDDSAHEQTPAWGSGYYTLRVRSVALHRRRRSRPDRGELTAESGQRIATAITKPIPRQLQEPATRCSERTRNRRFVRGPVAATR